MRISHSLTIRPYILGEYGSWAVAALSCLAGLFAAHRLDPGAVAVIAAVALFINSKQALTFWVRSKAPDSRKHLAVFFSQTVPASLLIVAAARHSLQAALPFLILPAAYLLFLGLKGEHFILTEIAGFFLLSVAAPLTQLGASGVIDVRLYVAVAVFFTAGVFKVRLQFKRRLTYRLSMAAYLVSAAAIYHLLELPLLALLPLADNLIFAVTLYKVKLRTAGRIEAAKGALFLILIAAFYAAR